MSTLLLPLLLACTAQPTTLQVSRLSAHGGSVGGLSLHLRGVEAGALADSIDVRVQTRSGEGEWSEADVTEAGGTDHMEVTLVADNSGSEDGYLDPMQAAVGAFGHAILDGAGPDQVGLVRVSTQSGVALELTGDEAAWDAAVGDLFISNGWTALWDGIRMGNEVLEDGTEVSAGGGLEVCLSQARRSVVVFTDGQENNSADEHPTSYAGDGIDTSFDDLTAMSVLGVPTPVYTVGIGTGVDSEQLSALALESGGETRAIDAYDELQTALTDTVAGLYDEIPVCFEAATRSDDQARITVSDGSTTWTADVTLPSLCGCTRTRGYWRTHEDAWPVDSLELGGESYSQADCLDILGESTGGDKSLQMAAQLIAAKLNVAAGADGDEVADEIDAADAWLADHGIGGHSCDHGSTSWDGGEDTKDALDDWNNGVTGPGECD